MYNVKNQRHHRLITAMQTLPFNNNSQFIPTSIYRLYIAILVFCLTFVSDSGDITCHIYIMLACASFPLADDCPTDGTQVVRWVTTI